MGNGNKLVKSIHQSKTVIYLYLILTMGTAVDGEVCYWKEEICLCLNGWKYTYLVCLLSVSVDRQVFFYRRQRRNQSINRPNFWTFYLSAGSFG